MSTIRNKLIVNQGTTFSVNVEIDTDIDLSEYSIRGQFRKSHGSKYFTDFNFFVINATNFQMSLTPSETSTLQSGLYVYDVEIEKDGVVHRILEGDLLLRPEVTRES